MSELEPNIEKEVIEALMKAWKKYPDMRLTQLLVNAIASPEPCPSVFYIEDSKLIEKLNKFAEDTNE